MTMLLRRWTVLPALGLMALLTGCGSTFVDTGPDLREQRLTLILRVQDPDGNAIGSAQVYVDGEEDEWWTDSYFFRLGEGYPEEWQGFLANWVSEGWAVYDDGTPPGGDRFDLAVLKVGWTEGVTIVVIPDSAADHFFVRDVVTLYPEGSGGPSPDPQYAEVLPDYAVAAVAATAGQPRKLIRPARD